MSKLSISRAWDESKAILARDGKLFTTIALALFVLPGTISAIVQPQVAQGGFPPLGYWTAVAAVSILIGLVGQLALIRLASGNRGTVGETIGEAFRRAPAYIAATILWLAPFALAIIPLYRAMTADPQNPPPAAALGIVAIAIVMLFIAIRMLLTSAVASTERVGPVAILKRSWVLTKGNWWRLFGFFLLYMIAAGILTLAVGAVFGSVATLALGGIEPLSIGALLVGLANNLVSAALSVVFMVMLARLYLQAAGPQADEVAEVFR